MKIDVNVTVNGIARSITCESDHSILDALRDDLRNTGSWLRCGEGRCGGCVVLLNGKRVLACDLPVIKANHGTIKTI